MRKSMWFAGLFLAVAVPMTARAQWWDVGFGVGEVQLVLPDLACTPMPHAPLPINQVVIRLSNIGTTTAPSTWLDVFIELDGPLHEVGDASTTYVRTKQLAPGQFVDYTFVVPQTIVEGADPTYYYACVVDTFDDVIEWDDFDNNVYNTYRQVF